MRKTSEFGKFHDDAEEETVIELIMLIILPFASMVGD